MLNLPYKKLVIWQKGMELARLVYEITRLFLKEEIFGLSSQMKRSAVSIPSNIAEGSQRNSNKDFTHFISMAQGSLAELETQTCLARDFGYITEKQFEELSQRIEELHKMLYAFRKSLEEKDNQ